MPHKGDYVLLHMSGNWQPMTLACNTIKSNDGTDDRVRRCFDSLVAQGHSKFQAVMMIKANL